MKSPVIYCCVKGWLTNLNFLLNPLIQITCSVWNFSKSSFFWIGSCHIQLSILQLSNLLCLAILNSLIHIAYFWNCFNASWIEIIKFFLLLMNWNSWIFPNYFEIVSNLLVWNYQNFLLWNSWIFPNSQIILKCFGIRVWHSYAG